MILKFSAKKVVRQFLSESANVKFCIEFSEIMINIRML